MKKRLQAIAAYLRLFIPYQLSRLLKRTDEAGFNRGYLHGLQVGHRRGWMAMRSKVRNAGNKYPHEPEAVAEAHA